MVALLGNLHVYRGDNSEWFATCHIPPDEAYITVLAASNIEIIVNNDSVSVVLCRYIILCVISSLLPGYHAKAFALKKLHNY